MNAIGLELQTICGVKNWILDLVMESKWDLENINRNIYEGNYRKD